MAKRIQRNSKRLRRILLAHPVINTMSVGINGAGGAGGAGGSGGQYASGSGGGGYYSYGRRKGGSLTGSPGTPTG